jgi:hypothetical protein
LDAATLLAKLKEDAEEHAWRRDYSPPAEKLPRFGMTFSNEEIRWFESENVVDLVAVRRVLNKAQGEL